MILSAIVAVGENNEIGKDNDLLWRLPNDMRFFRTTTSGHAVIMGRKTLESFGKPLKNRENIVITRSQDYQTEGVHITHNLQEAIELARSMGEEEAFLLGGGQIYAEGLKFCDRLYLTQVHGTFEADTFFPAIKEEEWKEIHRENHPADERHAYAYTFLTYERVLPSQT